MGTCEGVGTEGDTMGTRAEGCDEDPRKKGWLILGCEDYKRKCSHSDFEEGVAWHYTRSRFGSILCKGTRERLK